MRGRVFGAIWHGRRHATVGDRQAKGKLRCGRTHWTYSPVGRPGPIVGGKNSRKTAGATAIRPASTTRTTKSSRENRKRRISPIKTPDHGHSSRQRPCSLAEPMTRRVPVIATEWSAYFADSLIASATDSGAAACFGSGWLRNASKPIQPMSATSEYHSASINTVSGEIRRVAVERR